jgi:hypothetical protein
MKVGQTNKPSLGDAPAPEMPRSRDEIAKGFPPRDVGEFHVRLPSAHPENPPWYDFGEHQPWDVMYERWGAGALLAHALSYVMRAGRKPGASMLQDVRKAIDFLKHLEGKLIEEEGKRCR